MTLSPKARHLGAELRALRELAGLDQAEVAPRLSISRPSLSRIENGHRPASPEETSALLAVYGVTGQRREELMNMARTPNGPSWLQAIAPRLPNDSVTLATLEHEAARVTDWATLIVPGLLQTMDYATAVMTDGGVPEAEIGDRVIARKRRQDRLREVEYTAFIHEAALHIPIGGTRVMEGQLRSLIQAIRDGLDVRIVPSAAGAHPGLVGSFMLIEFTDRTPTLHVELNQSDAFLTSPAEVEYYTGIVERLSAAALDASHSVRLIEEIARRGDS